MVSGERSLLAPVDITSMRFGIGATGEIRGGRLRPRLDDGRRIPHSSSSGWRHSLR